MTFCTHITGMDVAAALLGIGGAVVSIILGAMIECRKDARK